MLYSFFGRSYVEACLLYFLLNNLLDQWHKVCRTADVQVVQVGMHSRGNMYVRMLIVFGHVLYALLYACDGWVEGQGEDRSGQGATLRGADVGVVLVYCVLVVSPKVLCRPCVPSLIDVVQAWA